MTKNRYAMTLVTVFIVFALSIMNTVPVLADDAPPVTETPVVDAPPTQETTESTFEEMVVAEALASVPPETEVVVLNESAESLPLATQEAADVIYEGDPMWCPAGVSPGGAGCTTSYGSLQQLVADVGIGFSPSKNGVIWIENISFSSTGAIVFDGSTLGVWSTWSNFGLTLKGGWSGSGTTITTTPSTIQDSLSIINWNGDVTLSNITITNVATGSALRQAALDIETTKKITLTNVQVIGNTGAGTVNGAVLDNEDGTPGVFGNVTITNSTFNNNKDYGLIVESEGMITLAGVLANGNGAGGAYLSNINAAPQKNVIITSGTNEFIGNFAGNGLVIESAGSVTLKDITAQNNGQTGIYIDNTFGSAASAVTLSGTTIVSENLGNGIEVFSDGIIKASNLVANLNGQSGAILNNNSAATALGVTLSGSSQFKFNSAANGLYIESNGAIMANNITANNNGGYGAVFDNDGFANGSALVTLTGTNSFLDNITFSGLEIWSDGIVTLNNINSSGNGGFGLNVQNDGALTPKAVLLKGTNKLDGNNSGLFIQSFGAVTVNNLSASDNNSSGVAINNFNGSAAQNVTMNGYVTVNNNATGNGLSIYTAGTVVLNKVSANSNGLGGILVYNNAATAPKVITINGITNASYNGDDGISLLSLGAITLNSITANGNGESGLEAYNAYVGSAGGITLNGTSSFSDNGGSGLEMYSNGNILIKDLDANGNGTEQDPAFNGYGAFLQNNFSASTGNITVGGTTPGWANQFNGNFLSGLEVYSNGMVTLSNIYAAGNGLDNTIDTPYGHGVLISNDTAATPKTVTLLGENYFGYNYDYGLNISTRGAVTLNKIVAESNENGHGVSIVNSFDNLVPQNVTLNGYGEFYENGADGLFISTYGMITLNNIFAGGNFGNGFYLDNYSLATLVKNVTINGYAETYGNSGGYGLYVHSLGAITIANLEASSGNLDGAWLDNDEAGAMGGVTLTGSNGASYNTNSGLTILTRGAILANDLDAFGNLGGDGAWLDNSNAATPLAVTLTNTTTGASYFGENFGNGLIVLTRGAVTITKLMANYNGGSGAVIDNWSSGPAAPQMVTLNGYGQFYENGDDGLVIQSYGAITTNNLTAIANGQNNGSTGYGVYLDNCDDNAGACDAVTAKNVTLNGNNLFNSNWLDGLYVQSPGLIKANNVTASYNAGGGARLDNQWNFGSAGITLTGVNTFEGNGTLPASSNGLTIYSNGAVTASNLTASGNSGHGAFINTYNISSPAAKVTLTGTNTFNGNGDFVTGGGQDGAGLVVFTDTAITINNLNANGNTEAGAYLSGYQGGNFWGPVPAMLKLTGINTFNDNGTEGLIFLAPGSVDITRITADFNDGDGVYGYSELGNITISCGSMNGNTGVGWYMQLDGGIGKLLTLKGVFSLSNTGGNTNQVGGTLVTTRTCPLP